MIADISPVVMRRSMQHHVSNEIACSCHFFFLPFPVLVVFFFLVVVVVVECGVMGVDVG